MSPKIYTASADETKVWGRQLAPLLFPGAVVGLEGELGAGKTCFVKGLATGLGINEEEISSPTFTLIAEHYRGRIPLYHIDLYRLEGGTVEELGIEDYLFGQGVSIVEWFGFLPTEMVEEYLLISFSFQGEDGRELTLTSRGTRYAQVVEALLKARLQRDLREE